MKSSIAVADDHNECAKCGSVPRQGENIDHRDDRCHDALPALPGSYPQQSIGRGHLAREGHMSLFISAGDVCSFEPILYRLRYTSGL
jgi:hypothetical protein